MDCGPQPILTAATHNLPAASAHREVVSGYLEKECNLGRVVEPLPEKERKVHISPIGVIPKKTPGKWRLIVDLSSPRNRSVNAVIDEDISSLSYSAGHTK